MRPGGARIAAPISSLAGWPLAAGHARAQPYGRKAIACVLASRIEIWFATDASTFAALRRNEVARGRTIVADPGVRPV